MGKLPATWIWISGLLLFSACSSVHQAHRAGAPVVEGSRTPASEVAVTRPSETEPATPEAEAETEVGPVGAGGVIPEAVGAPSAVMAESAESGIPKNLSSASDNPAVVALLDDTDLKIRQGNAGGAIESVERALRLEPKNPWLWHRLALLRFGQQQWRQAVALAEKSNSLSARYPELRKANSELIKQALQRH